MTYLLFTNTSKTERSPHMRFEISNRASLISKFKKCPVLASIDQPTAYVISLVDQGMPWEASLPYGFPNISFYELRDASSMILEIVQEYGVSATYNANLHFPQMIKLGLVSPRDFEPQKLKADFSKKFETLKVDCDETKKTTPFILAYAFESNILTISAHRLSRNSYIKALYPIWLLHEFCHILENCTFEKSIQAVLFAQEAHLQRSPSDREFQIAAHCARFRYVLLTLSLNANLIRKELFDQILATIQPTFPTHLIDIKQDPYAWESPIHQSFAQETASGNLSSPMRGVHVEYPNSLAEARKRFISRPNYSRMPKEILFESQILSVNEETNLLKLASSKYALDLLTDVYLSKIPTRISTFKTNIPALIATYDSEIDTLCFFYTNGISDFFEITPMEAFWVLDFFS